MAQKKGSHLGQEHQKLTPAESEVLSLIINEFLTIKKASIRRGCSVRNTQKIVKNLRQKGYLKHGFQKVRFFQGTSEPSNHQIRLHGQEWNIKILYKPYKYRELVGKLVELDGNTIRLYRDSLEIYSGHSFYADTAHKATSKSMLYWTKFFTILENEFRIIIFKPRTKNIDLVNQHYAEINNELAGECERKGDKIRVYTTDEGKLWFTIDNSLNLHEAETQHPMTAKDDMQEVVSPFFNDLRNNKELPKISEIWSIISQITKHEKEIAAGLHSMVSMLKHDQPQEDHIKERPDYFG